MYNDSASNADLDDFVSRAEQINAAVRGLASGTLEPEDTNHLLTELDQARARTDPAAVARREEQKAKAEEERKRRGVKGQGARPGYLYFCKRCFLEYDLEPLPPANATATAAGSGAKGGAGAASKSPPVCVHCSSALETREQRMEELMGKVGELQARKFERAQRRQAYEQWRRDKVGAGGASSVVVVQPRIEEIQEGEDGQEQEQSQSQPSSTVAPAPAVSASSSRSLSTSYESWGLWEPSSDEESEVPQPDHPSFAAMRADIDAREARKRVARGVAERANQAGNESFKSRDYLAAIEHYSRAIDNVRDDKSYYTNRALASLHVYAFESALKDCQTALDIWECFEQGQTRFISDYKNVKVVLKAYLRRTRAQIGLGLLVPAREGLTAAAALVKQIYSVGGRASEPTYAKAQKDDLAEIQKLLNQVRDKETFEKEENRVKEAAAAAAAATAPAVEVKSVAPASASDAGDKQSTPVASQPSFSSSAAVGAATPTAAAVSSSDGAQLSALLSSLTEAHRSMLSTPSPSSTPSSAASLPGSPWAAMVPSVDFLVRALDGDLEGNKERVAAQVEARGCIDVLLKLLKHRSAPSQPPCASGASGPAAPGSGSLPPSLPDFNAGLAALAPAHPSRTSNGVWWREKGGFEVLAKYLNRLFAILSTTAPSTPTPSTSVSVPAELLLLAVRALMLLTDREQAREYLSGPAHAPVLTDLAVELLRSSSSSAPSAVATALGSPTPQQLEALQLCVTNLVANLAFQPRYRQWLCGNTNGGGSSVADASGQPSRLDGLYSALLGLAESCPLTNGKAGKAASITAATATPASTSGCTVLSAGLTALLNLLTHAGCRSRLVESSTGSSASASAAASAPTPLGSLISVLCSLASCWSASSYHVRAGSAQAELADKLLSVCLNLCVDEAANGAFFARLLATPASASASATALIERLLGIAAGPASDSRADATASATSITSQLPPLLVERALGLVTRGLRREHNAAAAATAATASTSAPAGSASSSRPLRALVVQHGGHLTAMRILAMHRFAATEEAVSADTVLAKLALTEPGSESGLATPAAASSSASGDAPFCYTRATLEHASVLLAICMPSDGAVARAVASLSWQGRAGLPTLVSLLSSPHRNVAGNACLCIDALTSLPDVLQRAEMREALPLLLDIVKDPAAKPAHQNAAKAAIIIGRAPNNAEQWTKLRGLEIIASVLAPTLLKKK